MCAWPLTNATRDRFQWYASRPWRLPLAPSPPLIEKSLRAIERAFDDLAATVAQLAARVHDVERTAAGRSATRRTLHITPKRRAQLKLQGKYMGLMRQLKPAQKLRVKAVREKRGFEAAIGVAKKLAGD